jgi:hypothetical protein
MSAPLGLRTLALAVGATWLLAASHTTAQAPQSAPDHDKRLRALEDKMDRVLKALEPRESSRPANAPVAAAIQTARDQVAEALKAKEQKLRQFQQSNPFAVHGGMQEAIKANHARLRNIEARRLESKLRRNEMADQILRIEKAFKSGGKAEGLQMMAAIGIRPEGPDGEAILSRLDRQRKQMIAVLGEEHAAVKEMDDAIALVRKVYAGRDGSEIVAAMKEEMKDLEMQIGALNNQFEQEAKTARELNAYEIEEDKFRNAIDSLRETLAGLDTILRGEKPSK